MALNIPNVGSGLEGLLQGAKTGGDLFHQLMDAKLKREELAQAWQKHLDALALQKAASGRASQSASDAHKLALMKLDPNYAINQLLRAQEIFGGNSSSPSPTALQSFMPGVGSQFGQSSKASQIPSLESINRGMEEEEEEEELGFRKGGPYGALEQKILNPLTSVNEPIPSINEQAISPYEAASVSAEKNKLDMEAIKKSPILRGMFKKLYGVDLGAEAKPSAFTGAAREAMDLVRLKKEFGENSEEYKTAEAIQNSKNQQRQDLSDKRQRELHGLKPGDVAIKDPETGEEIGYSKQLTKDQQMQEENKVKMDMLYPYVYNGGSILSGPGATLRFANAAKAYKTDPRARKIIDDFLIAEKALTNTTVTEAARFGSGKQNQVFNRYRESLQSEDMPKRLKSLIKQYGIPAEANLKAGKRWQEILGEVEEKAKKFVPARRTYFYNPEKQYAHDKEQEALRAEKEIGETVSKKVIVIDPSGRRFETTKANAAHLPEGWKHG